MEVLVRGQRVRSLLSELELRRFEVKMLPAASPLETLGRFRFVRSETIKQHAQETAKIALRPVVTRKAFGLENAREKRLRQILAILWRTAPGDACVFVERLPI